MQLHDRFAGKPPGFAAMLKTAAAGWLAAVGGHIGAAFVGALTPPNANAARRLPNIGQRWTK